jgi:hypothetical protein
VAPIIISNGVLRRQWVVAAGRKPFGVEVTGHLEALVNVYEPASNPQDGASFDLGAYFTAKTKRGEPGLKMYLLSHLGEVSFGRAPFSSADFYRPYYCCWL